MRKIKNHTLMTVRLIAFSYFLLGSLYLLFSIFNFAEISVKFANRVNLTLISTIPVFFIFIIWIYFLARSLVKYDKSIIKIIPFVLWILSFAIFVAPRPSLPIYSSEVANLRYDLAIAGLLYGSALGLKTVISYILKNLEVLGWKNPVL